MDIGLWKLLQAGENEGALIKKNIIIGNRYGLWFMSSCYEMEKQNYKKICLVMFGK